MAPTLFANASACAKSGNTYSRSRRPWEFTCHPGLSWYSSSWALDHSIGGTPPRHGTHFLSARLMLLPPIVLRFCPADLSIITGEGGEVKCWTCADLAYNVRRSSGRSVNGILIAARGDKGGSQWPKFRQVR